MANQPKVSVIMPIYNAAIFLPEAIESVLAQSFDSWELLLVDDGSADKSPEIAQAYAHQHPDKIYYLTHTKHQNCGKSTTRNLGIRRAQGDFITFLDADDIFLPHKLAHQVALLDANPQAGMVYGRTEYWHSWEGMAKSKQRDYQSKLGVKPNYLYAPPVLLTKFLRDSGSVPCICSLVVRRSLVLQVGLFDESIQHLYEDQVLLAKLTLAAPVFVEDACSERYRQHAASSSNQARLTGDYHPWFPDPSRLRFLNWLEKYLAETANKDEALRKALHRAFVPYRYPLFNLISMPVKYLLATASR